MTIEPGEIRPALKWAGGKAWMADRVRVLLPPRIAGTYHEPFAGGAAVFCSLSPAQLPLFDEPGRQVVPPRRASLNDLSPDLIRFYEAVRDDVELLMSSLRALRDRYLAEPYRDEPSEGGRSRIFQEIRRAFNGARDDARESAAQAARYLFLNKAGFNGLMRYNRDGEINTPHGAMRAPAMLDPEQMRMLSRALRGVSLSCADFEVALASAVPGDAAYLDPPHATRSRTSSFRGYTACAWTDADDERVAAAFWRLARGGVRVVLSQANTPRMRGLLAGAEIQVVMRRGTISSKADRRQPVAEILAAAGPT